MKKSPSLVVILSLVALFTGGCRKDRDRYAPIPGQEDRSEFLLGDCKTSHEFRIVMDELEIALSKLKIQNDTGQFFHAAPMLAMESVNEAAKKRASTEFIQDLMAATCLREIHGFNGSGVSKVNPGLCARSASKDKNRFKSQPGDEEADLKGVRNRLQDNFLQTALDYAKETLDKITTRNGVGGKLLALGASAAHDLEEVSLTTYMIRHHPPYEQEFVRSESLGLKIDGALKGIQNLKQSAGATYLALACSPKEAFTLLGTPADTVPHGRGSSDLDVNPARPAETRDAEGRELPPAEVGT